MWSSVQFYLFENFGKSNLKITHKDLSRGTHVTFVYTKGEKKIRLIIG